MNLRKILCPVDFSEAAADAARYASAVAQRFSAELTLLHVAPAMAIEFSMAVPAQRRLLDLAQHHNHALRQTLDLFPNGGLDLPARRELAAGDAAEEILRISKEGRFDLIVMPTHGAGAIRRWLLLGSVTTKILQTSECPVLAAVDFGEDCRPPYLRHVYCAVDLGPQSEKVLCTGLALTKELDADLTVVHAAEAMEETAAELVGDDIRASILDGLRDKAAGLLQKTGARGEILIHSGKAYNVVADVVKSRGPGLVVIGRGVSEGMLGRLRAQAYEIIRRSPCPVLSV
jgi:nucleotide-binding universal stress UspA family protein